MYFKIKAGLRVGKTADDDDMGLSHVHVTCISGQCLVDTVHETRRKRAGRPLRVNRWDRQQSSERLWTRHPVAMRYITRLATLCLATAAAAAAHHGAIVLIPSSDHESQTPKTIQENVAKLILEQRLHSGQYSHLGTVDEAVAELLNEYGGAQEPLFGDAAERDPRRLLVVLDGVDADDSKLARAVGLISDGQSLTAARSSQPRPSMSTTCEFATSRRISQASLLSRAYSA